MCYEPHPTEPLCYQVLLAQSCLGRRVCALQILKSVHVLKQELFPVRGTQPGLLIIDCGGEVGVTAESLEYWEGRDENTCPLISAPLLFMYSTVHTVFHFQSRSLSAKYSENHKTQQGKYTPSPFSNHSHL